MEGVFKRRIRTRFFFKFDPTTLHQNSKQWALSCQNIVRKRIGLKSNRGLSTMSLCISILEIYQDYVCYKINTYIFIASIAMYSTLNYHFQIVCRLFFHPDVTG